MTKQLVDLSARDEFGAASNRAYVTLGYRVDALLAAEICSGFRFALAASFAVDAAAGVEFAEFLEASLELEAGVEVKAELTAQLSGDVTDTFGLHLEAAALARAYVRARLDILVELGDLLEDLLTRNDGALSLEDRLLLALVEKIRLEMGVEAHAEFAVAAAALVSARVRLQADSGEEAGFDLRVSAGAAFLYGAGVAVYLRGRLPTLEDYLNEAVELTAQALLGNRTDMVGRVVEAGLTAAGRVVIAGLLENPGDREKNATVALSDLLQNVGTIAVEALVEAAVGEAVAAALQTITPIPRELLEEAVALPETLSLTQAPNVASAIKLLAKFSELADPPSGTSDEPLIVQISAALHALMFLAAPADPLFDPPLPDHVLRVAGLPEGQVRFKTAREAVTVLDGGALNRQLGALPEPLDKAVPILLSELGAAGISLGTFLAGEIPDEEAFGKVARGFADTFIADVLLPEAEKQLTDLEDAGALPEILADLIRTLLLGSTKLILPTLTELSNKTGNQKQQAEQLRHYATQMAASFVMRQIADFSAVMMKNSVRDFDDRMSQMLSEIEDEGSGFADRLIDPILMAISDAIPGDDLRRSPRRAEMLRITRSMMRALCEAGQTAFGSQTWSNARIDRLSAAVIALSTGEDENGIDWKEQSPADLQNSVDALAQCNPLVGEVKKFVDLVGQDVTDISIAQAKVFFQEVPRILADHLPDLCRELVLAGLEEALEALAEWIDAALERLDKTIKDLKQDLEELADEVTAALAAAVKAADELMDAVLAWAEQQIDDLLAALDFDADGIIERVIDAVATFFGADDLVVTDAESARQELRRIKTALPQRLQSPAFVALRRAALSAGEGGPADLEALQESAINRIYTSSEKTVLDNLPLQEGTRFADAGRSKLGTLNVKKLAQREKSADLESSRERKALRDAWLTEAEQTRDAHHKQQADAVTAFRAARGIRFNAPLNVNPSPEGRPADLPIYGPNVQLEIDFGSFPVKLIDQMPDLSFAEIVRDQGDQPALAPQLIDRLLRNDTIDATVAPLIDVRLFVNGREIAIKELVREGSRLSGTLAPDLLKPGRNHVLLTVTAPKSLGLGPPIVHHVTFLRDARSDDRPSNTIGFDRAACVINTRGDDHFDARKGTSGDRELIVIRNRSNDRRLELTDWEIEDARGHVFRFPRRKLVERETVSVMVGPSDDPTQLVWVEDYGLGPIALLNNDGERLLLRAPNGQIVSQLFAGSPASNPDIRILRERTSQ